MVRDVIGLPAMKVYGDSIRCQRLAVAPGHRAWRGVLWILVTGLVIQSGIALAGSLPAPGSRTGTVVGGPRAPFADSWKAMLHRDQEKAALKILSESPGIEEAPNPPPEALLTQKPPTGGYAYSPPPSPLAGMADEIEFRSIAVQFDGPTLVDEWQSFSGGSFPPDHQMAAGPNHVVSLVNGGAMIQTRGGTRLSFVSLNSFFFFIETETQTPYPRFGAFDPRLFYDIRSKRWYACALERGAPLQVQGEKTPRQHHNHLVLAITRTSDPMGQWDKYLIPAGLADYPVPSNSLIGGGGLLTPVITYFTDYPIMGIDDNGLYFGVSLFVTPGSISYPRILATPLQPLLQPSPSLGPVTVWDLPKDMAKTPVPLQSMQYVGPLDPQFFVASPIWLPWRIAYRRLWWIDGTPWLSGVEFAGTPVYGDVPKVYAGGTLTKIDTGDTRLLQGIRRFNRLYTCRTVGLDENGQPGGSRAGCEALVFQLVNGFDGSLFPLLEETVRVYDNQIYNPRSYFYPSLTPITLQDLVIGYSGCRSNEFVSAYFTERIKVAPPFSLVSLPTLIHPGEASYVRLDSRKRNRWGDYSQTCIDGKNGMDVWTIQEYADTPQDTWATRIAKIGGTNPRLDNLVYFGLPGDHISTQIFGANLFDGGADFPDRLQFELLGGAPGEITNVGIEFLGDPSFFYVDFDIARSATPGPRDIRVTNPDGLFAILPGGFTLLDPGQPTPLPTLTPTPSPSATPSLTPTPSPSPEPLDPCLTSLPIRGAHGVSKQVSQWLPDFPAAFCTPEIYEHAALWCFRVGPEGTVLNLRVHTDLVDVSVPVAFSVRRCCSAPETELACERGFAESAVRIEDLYLPPGFYTVAAETNGEYPLYLTWSSETTLGESCYDECAGGVEPTPIPTRTPPPPPVDPCAGRIPIEGTIGGVDLELVKASYVRSSCAIPEMNHAAALCFQVPSSGLVTFTIRAKNTPNEQELRQSTDTIPMPLAISLRRVCDNSSEEVACLISDASDIPTLPLQLEPGTYTGLVEASTAVTVEWVWNSDPFLSSACDPGPPTPTPSPTPRPTPLDTEDSDGDGFANGFERLAGSDPYEAGSVPAVLDLNADGVLDATDAILYYRNRMGLVPILPVPPQPLPE